MADVPAYAPCDPAASQETASGLVYEVLEEGEGRSPSASDHVTVHYAGWLEDGTLFDSSYGRGQTATFPLNAVIAGWTEGVQLMKEGAVYRFAIPGPLAYGSTPPPGSGIPPDATLVFQVELLGIA